MFTESHLRIAGHPIVANVLVTGPVSSPDSQSLKPTWDKASDPPCPSLCHSLSPNSRKFFELEIIQPGLGMRHLICQAFTGDTILATALTAEEITIHLDLIQQCLHNSRTANARLGRIIRNIIVGMLSNPCRPTIIPHEFHSGILNTLVSNPQNNFTPSQLVAISHAIRHETAQVINRCERSYDVFRVTRLPTHFSEIRKFYLEGKDAIIPNLPCPKAIMLEDEVHAYISPMEIISHYLAFGHGNQTCPPMDPKRPGEVTCYHHSAHARILQGHVDSTIGGNPSHSSFPLIIFLTDWQDEFDKNNIIRNKYQIFLRVLTILMQGKRGVLEKNTFIIALGTKGDSRFTLDEVYNQDLLQLSRCHEVYDGRYKRNIKIMAILVASLEDRIERSGMLFIGQQNQNFCASFGHSTYLHKESKLPSCNICFDARNMLLFADGDGKSYGDGIAPCQVCADWFVLCDNGALDVGMEMLPLYPKDTYPGSPLPPPERPVGTHVKAIGPMRISFPQLRIGADFAFYNFHYSKTKPGPRPINWTIGKMEFYVKSIGLNQAFSKSLRLCADKYKDDETYVAMNHFRNEVHPPSWDRPHSGLSAHLEATFHCVFRGLVPDHVEICLAGLRTVTSMVPVHRVLNRILKSVKQLYLPRMNISLFGKKENKLSMVGWQGSQENAFSKLMVHCLLHCRIHASKKLSVTVETMNEVFYLLEKATFAFYCTISRIMSTDVTEYLPDETLHYARLYLSYLTDLEKVSLVPGKSPVWKRTGNHVGLLNIPEVMRRYGPVHTYYEAADESTIQWMKPMVKNVSTTSHSWKVTVLDAITREQTLTMVTEDSRNLLSGEGTEDDPGWNPYDFRVSSSLNELKHKFSVGESLSAVCYGTTFPLFPFWGIHEITGKRVIQYLTAHEFQDESIVIGGIRYSCFDSILVESPESFACIDSMPRIRDCATHIYLLLFLIPENGTCLQGNKLFAHVCGINWDVLNPDTYDLVVPKWSDWSEE
jgi:hypothetical protein